MPDFKGRARELASLRSIFSAKGGALIVLSGRRRVGKSRLLEEALREMPSVLFQATRVTSAINLGDFKAAITRAMGSDPLLESIGNWEGVFVYLAKIAEDRHPGLVVCLDEFPHITDNDPALPSILQRFWDSREAERGAMKIVLWPTKMLAVPTGPPLSQSQRVLTHEPAAIRNRTGTGVRVWHHQDDIRRGCCRVDVRYLGRLLRKHHLHRANRSISESRHWLDADGSNNHGPDWANGPFLPW